jgi:hypothetical protein
MKVRELIDQLGNYDPEMEVHTSYCYGDYWRTQVAPKVGYIEEAQVEYSEYHRMDKLVEDTDDYEDEEEAEDVKETLRRVVIIG